MASVKDFCSQLESLDAVDHYLLVAADGRIVTQAMPDADQISSLITLTMLAADRIEDGAKSGRLQTVVLGVSEGKSLVIFSLGKWILAVQKHSHAPQHDLNKQVQSVINNFRNS